MDNSLASFPPSRPPKFFSMLEISGGPVDCSVPDDLSIPQFFLDSHHPLRPVRKSGIPWLVEDATGRHIDFEEVRGRSIPHHADPDNSTSCVPERLESRMHSRHGMESVSVRVCPLFSESHAVR